MKLCVLAVLLAVSCGWVSAQGGNIKVGSYDLGDLDQDKLDNNDALSNIISQVAYMHDILLLQGIKSLDVMGPIKEMIEQNVPNQYWPGYWTSSALGENGDEYFVFIYNTWTVEENDVLTYTEGTFKYAPVAASFQVYNGVLKDLYIGAVKLDPDRAQEELMMIPEARSAAEMYFSAGQPLNWIIMGKLYTDTRCSKITEEELNQFLEDSGFTQQIEIYEGTPIEPDQMCAPDSVLTSGDRIEHSISWSYINTLSGLNMDKDVMAASDYYPITVEMYSEPIMTAGSTVSGVGLWITLLALILAGLLK